MCRTCCSLPSGRLLILLALMCAGLLDAPLNAIGEIVKISNTNFVAEPGIRIQGESDGHPSPFWLLQSCLLPLAEDLRQRFVSLRTSRFLKICHKTPKNGPLLYGFLCVRYSLYINHGNGD